jgi:CRP/FNR family transcriptional regulator, cyclic AMP receptor protein
MLAEPARRKLISRGVIRSFSANHVLLRQGEPPSSVWLLLDALVKVVASVENGTQVLLAIRVSGDVAGDAWLPDVTPAGGKCPGGIRMPTCGHRVLRQVLGTRHGRSIAGRRMRTRHVVAA